MHPLSAGITAWLPTGGTVAAATWFDVQEKCAAIFEDACTLRSRETLLTCEKGHVIEGDRRLTTWGMEAERDGLRIALSLQLNAVLKPRTGYGVMSANAVFTTINTLGNGYGSPAPEPEKVWTPFEIEILQYDNEHKIDVGFICSSADVSMEKLKTVSEWLACRRASFWVPGSP